MQVVVKEKKEDSLFKLLNFLYRKDGEYPSKEEIAPKVFMVNRFVSLDLDLTEVIGEISKYVYTLKELYYKLLYRIIPKSKSPRTSYPKFEKEFDSELVSKYALYFRISRKEAVEYIRILSKIMEMKKIYDFVGLEKK